MSVSEPFSLGVGPRAKASCGGRREYVCPNVPLRRIQYGLAAKSSGHHLIEQPASSAARIAESLCVRPHRRQRVATAEKAALTCDGIGEAYASGECHGVRS